jgi:branched-chain amino acid transport system permease protein
MKQGTGIGRSRFPFRWIVIIVLLIVLVIIPFVVQAPNSIHILIMIFYMGYLATAWGLVGQGGQLSFGHAAFLGLGAYTTGVLFQDFGITPWLGMWAGVAVATIAGFIIGYPTLRLRGIYFALATFAFAFILQIVIMHTWEVGPVMVGASPGLEITLRGDAPGVFQFATKTPYYFIALGMLVSILSLSYLLNRSRIGYYWSAMRSDQDAAESLGIHVGKYRLITFLISCALTAIGGTFYTQYFLFIDPTRVLDIGLSIEIVVVGIVGGWQSVFGPVIGALVIVPIGQLVRAHLGGTVPGLHLIIYGVILMLFILFLPRGLNEPVSRGMRWLETKLGHRAESGNDKQKG